jgi:DNA-directed RNA polymerase subunit F
MMPRKILSKEEIPMAKAAKLLGEHEVGLTPLQMRVLSYGRKYSRLPSEQAELLVERLMKEFELSRKEAVQVADICPTTVDELRVVLGGYKRLVASLLFSEDKMQRIVEMVKAALSGELA